MQELQRRRVFGIFIGKCNSRSSYGSCAAGNDDASCRDVGSAWSALPSPRPSLCDTLPSPYSLQRLPTAVLVMLSGFPPRASSFLQSLYERSFNIPAWVSQHGAPFSLDDALSPIR
jgi:hypothetical protein